MTDSKYYKENSEKEKKAGKVHTIYSDPNGIDLFATPKKYPGDIHDTRNVPGWNNTP